LDAHSTYTGNAPVILDDNVRILDVELQTGSSYGGSTLMLSRHGGANVNDVFSAKTNGNLSALNSGSFFSVGGVTIGLVVINSNGTLQLGFNSNATQTLVSQAMQQIAYANTASIPPAQAEIEWTFSDGNTGTQGIGGALTTAGSTVVKITARNVAPVVANPLSDISLLPNTELNYTVPANAFFDANKGESLVFSISMNDGTALPRWLVFDPVTHTLGGNPGMPGAFDQSVFNIKATARDQTGATASDVFALTIGTTISGAATQGQILSAGKDLVSTGSVSYQWLGNGQPISGNTGNTLVLGQAQVGKTISVTATYSINGGTPASATSDPTVSVANINDLPTGAVNITGTAMQGQTLTAANTLDDLDGLGTISYQWSAGGTPITGATSNTLVLGQAEVGKTITVTASYTDTFSHAESVSSAAVLVDKNLDLTSYSWKAHTLLDGVKISAGTHSGITGPTGAAGLTGITEASLTLAATRTIPVGEVTTTSNAVNLQDAIAILKMIVGLDVNGSGHALSPYQAFAADFDGNGTVGLTDAIGVLKHVVGLGAPDPTWHFLNETDTSILGKAALNPGLPQTSVTADLSGTSPVHIGLVGYLTGDVDGSYAGAVGASDLDVIQPDYIATLVGSHPELSLGQFGVYAA
jgi:hypothetical protein